MFMELNFKNKSPYQQLIWGFVLINYNLVMIAKDVKSIQIM